MQSALALDCGNFNEQPDCKKGIQVMCSPNHTKGSETSASQAVQQNKEATYVDGKTNP